jgi:serine/threonine-protein kinase ULK/ATG1
MEEVRTVRGYSYSRRACIGQGAFGRVFLATAPGSSKKLALKRIEERGFQHDPLFSEKVHREARLMGLLSSPHIVRLHDYFKEGESHYLIMEYCEGGTLKALLAREHGEKTALRMARDLVSAFQELDRHRIIHNDLNPTNILCHQGSFKLSDFSIATQDGLFSEDDQGHFLYKSPQRLKGAHYTSKSDVWSLGLVFYEAVFGSPPWPSSSAEDLLAKIYANKITIKKSALSELSQNLILKTLASSEKTRASWQDLFSLLNPAPEQLIKSTSTDLPADHMRSEKDTLATLCEFVEVELVIQKSHLEQHLGQFTTSLLLALPTQIKKLVSKGISKLSFKPLKQAVKELGENCCFSV